MHWWVACHLCSLGHVKWYDLGGSDGDAGLHQFKKGFVGKSGTIVDAPPRYHRAEGRIPHLAGSLAYWAKDRKSALDRFAHSVRKKAG